MPKQSAAPVGAVITQCLEIADSVLAESGVLFEYSDGDLADWFKRIAASTEDVLVLASRFTSRFLTRIDAKSDWLDVGHGEFGLKCIDSVKVLVNARRLWWADSTGPVETVALTEVTLANPTTTQLRKWVTSADQVIGRDAEASKKTRDEVAYLAAWRCQFSGCGKNLRAHTATGARGQFSYFAHIIAASEQGPRGVANLSARLADDPTNILLLCDECHRLVDRVNPGKYDAQMLRTMRERSIQEVARILNALQYPEARPLVILGNITGQTPQFEDRDAEEAMWGSGLRASVGRTERFLSFGGVHHDPHSAGYWDTALRSTKADLPRLQSYINGTLYGESRTKVAIFPLHGTSILILTGRILGDASGTHLFQPHRNMVGGFQQTRWEWTVGAVAPPADKYKARELLGPSIGCKEACLLVSLTFNIEPSRLPPPCWNGSALTLPTLEVYVDVPNTGVIGHPHDLQLFGQKLDEALQTLQDIWKVEKVHLIVGAPTTACVVVGQKMQARNQAAYVCHESESGIGKPFFPTIDISSTHVRHLASNQEISLQP